MALRPTPSEPVFKRLRIAILLFILFIVAFDQFLASWRSTDWNDPLWVDVWLVNGDGSALTQSYLDGIGPDAFAAIERFFAGQAQAYGVALETPFRIWLAGQIDEPPPAAPEAGGWLEVVAWSLRMRWFVTRLHFANDGPTPDITLFAVYRAGGDGVTLDRSTALRKGMIAVAHLFAKREMHGSNEMIMAHEMLHTLGAGDKYDPATALPLFPVGFAEPGRSPPYPQAKAELMAGRIPIGPHAVEVPGSLGAVVIGPTTAYEIGWIDDPDEAGLTH
jgi:hypothetical protein